MIRVQASAEGMSTFQPSAISWSYLIRGSVPRSQMKQNSKIAILARNQSSGHQPELAPGHTEIGQGARHPPRNRVVASPATVVMLTYSARKNRANFSDEYSVW